MLARIETIPSWREAHTSDGLSHLFLLDRGAKELNEHFQSRISELWKTLNERKNVLSQFLPMQKSSQLLKWIIF